MFHNSYQIEQSENRAADVKSRLFEIESLRAFSAHIVLVHCSFRISPVGGEAKRFVIAKGNQRALVYFWYHSRGRVIAQSHHKILWMFLDRARFGRTDGSLVRFTIPIEFGDEAAAEATFTEFANLVTPLLPEFVPN